MPSAGIAAIDHPGVDHRLCRRYHGKDEEKVLAHAGRLSDGIPCIEGHDARGQSGGQTRGGRHGPEIQARVHVEHLAREDRRLHENDICHRQKRGQPGQKLGPRVGAVFAQPEESIKHGHNFTFGHIRRANLHAATGTTAHAGISQPA